MIRVEMIRSQVLQLEGLTEIIGVGSIIKFNVYESRAFIRKYGKDIKIEVTGIVTGDPEIYNSGVGKDNVSYYLIKYCKIPLKLQMRIGFTSVPKMIYDEATLDFIWTNSEWTANLIYFEESFSISIKYKTQISNFK